MHEEVWEVPGCDEGEWIRLGRNLPEGDLWIEVADDSRIRSIGCVGLSVAQCRELAQQLLALAAKAELHTSLEG